MPNETLKFEAVSVTPVVVRKFPMLGLEDGAELKVNWSKLNPSSRSAKLLSVAYGIEVNCGEVTVAVCRVARVCESPPVEA